MNNNNSLRMLCLPAKQCIPWRPKTIRWSTSTRNWWTQAPCTPLACRTTNLASIQAAVHRQGPTTKFRHRTRRLVTLAPCPSQPSECIKQSNNHNSLWAAWKLWQWQRPPGHNYCFEVWPRPGPARRQWLWQIRKSIVCTLRVLAFRMLAKYHLGEDSTPHAKSEKSLRRRSHRRSRTRSPRVNLWCQLWPCSNSKWLLRRKRKWPSPLRGKVP